MNDYVRRTLKFEADAPYEVLKGLYLNWGWKDFANRYASVGETLRKALAMNPHMRVLVANGYYDFATPHFASDYTFDHMGIDPAVRGNFSRQLLRGRAHDVRAQAVARAPGEGPARLRHALTRTIAATGTLPMSPFS